jgi:hypothetical protein
MTVHDRTRLTGQLHFVFAKIRSVISVYRGLI